MIACSSPPPRLVPDKGIDVAIRAFRDSGLAERGYRYLIAGRDRSKRS